MNEYLTVTVIIIIVLAAASTAAITSLPLQAADVATTTTTLTTVSPVLLVPIAISADNIYVACQLIKREITKLCSELLQTIVQHLRIK
jgi:hypothetical protein